MQDAVCQLKNITKKYENNGCCPIQNIDFTANRGDYISIEGPSGIGKSTLLYLIGGLLKPTSGEIYYAGKKVKSFSEKYMQPIRRHQISYIFQDFRYINVFTVQENLEFIAKSRKSNIKSVKEEIDYYLEQLCLQDKRNEYPCNLSGGQKRRLMIGLALVKDTQIIIADEPTNDLDLLMEDVVLRLFDEKIKERKTIILSTHNHRVSQKVHLRYQLLDSQLIHLGGGTMGV